VHPTFKVAKNYQKSHCYKFNYSVGNTNDYVTWKAHESNKIEGLDTSCMLGAERTFIRRKKGTVCLNGDRLVPTQTFKVCQCQNDDFLWYVSDALFLLFFAEY